MGESFARRARYDAAWRENRRLLAESVNRAMAHQGVRDAYMGAVDALRTNSYPRALKRLDDALCETAPLLPLMFSIREDRVVLLGAILERTYLRARGDARGAERALADAKRKPFRIDTTHLGKREDLYRFAGVRRTRGQPPGIDFGLFATRNVTLRRLWELAPEVEEQESEDLRPAFAPSKRGMARALGLSVRALDALLDHYGITWKLFTAARVRENGG